jgi:hypothetical protein
LRWKSTILPSAVHRMAGAAAQCTAEGGYWRGKRRFLG